MQVLCFAATLIPCKEGMKTALVLLPSHQTSCCLCILSFGKQYFDGLQTLCILGWPCFTLQLPLFFPAVALTAAPEEQGSTILAWATGRDQPWRCHCQTPWEDWRSKGDGAVKEAGSWLGDNLCRDMPLLAVHLVFQEHQHVLSTRHKKAVTLTSHRWKPVGG